MSHRELRIEVEPQSISVWKRSWAERSSRVTLLVDFDEQFAVIRDTQDGYWFLPGGGVEPNESIEEAARREAFEELGLEVEVNQVIKVFCVTLNSKETKEQLRIPPFIVVHATPIGGQLKTGYAPNRKVVLIRKDKCNNLLRNFEVPKEYEWMKPYFFVSKETIREFQRHLYDGET